MHDVMLRCGWVPRFTRQQLAEHRHPAMEIITVLAGQPRWQVEGQVEQLRCGWVHFTLPGQRHGSADATEAPRAVCWGIICLDRDYEHTPAQFAFHPDLGIPARDARRISQRLLGFGRNACPASPQLLWLWRQVIEEHAGKRPGWRELVARYAAATIYELERCLHAVPDLADDQQQHRRVRGFLAELDERCIEAWTLAGMAASCGLGRTRFTELCQAIAGESPMAVLQRKRIDVAKRLLRSSERSITDIALSCGFGSSQYFARIFKRLVGCTASDFR